MNFKTSYFKLINTSLAARKIMTILLAPIAYPLAIGEVLAKGVKGIWTEIVKCGYSIVATVRDVNKFYKDSLSAKTLPSTKPASTVW